MQLAESPMDDALADAAQIWRLAGRLERISLHPVASAFAEFDDGREVLDARAVMAAGVQGRISGGLYRLGKPDWVAEQTGQTLTPPGTGQWLALSADRLLVAWLRGDSPLRAGARDMVDELKARGLSLGLASRDRTENVAGMAPQPGD